MNYIVFDLEWNQPANETLQVLEPVYLTGEIIEIGAVKLNDRFETVDELRLYIQPRYYEKMHRKIASLTGISDRCLQQQGLPFPEAMEQFLAWCGEDYGYITWSDSDLPVLMENMQLWGMDVSRMPPSYDAQRMFGRELMREDRQYSLDSALEALGLQGDKAHDALHDARNTVMVLDRLELDTYLSEYETQAFGISPDFRVYESVHDILEDPEAAAVLCPWCGERVSCRNWVSLPGHRYAAAGSCPEEDEFLLEISPLPNPKGGWRCSRLLYDMSDDLWEQYQDRLELQGLAGVRG